MPPQAQDRSFVGSRRRSGGGSWRIHRRWPSRSLASRSGAGADRTADRRPAQTARGTGTRATPSVSVPSSASPLALFEYLPSRTAGRRPSPQIVHWPEHPPHDPHGPRIDPRRIPCEPGAPAYAARRRRCPRIDQHGLDSHLVQSLHRCAPSIVGDPETSSCRMSRARKRTDPSGKTMWGSFPRLASRSALPGRYRSMRSTSICMRSPFIMDSLVAVCRNPPSRWKVSRGQSGSIRGSPGQLPTFSPWYVRMYSANRFA